MICNGCGEKIGVGYEYWHDPVEDENFHFFCTLNQERNQRLVKRYLED